MDSSWYFILRWNFYEILALAYNRHSSVSENDNLVKMLYTPNLLYSDELNEISVQLEGSSLKETKLFYTCAYYIYLNYQLTDSIGNIIINRETILMFKIAGGATSIKSISFASTQNDELHEIFYKWHSSNWMDWQLISNTSDDAQFRINDIAGCSSYKMGLLDKCSTCSSKTSYAIIEYCRIVEEFEFHINEFEIDCAIFTTNNSRNDAFNRHLA